MKLPEIKNDPSFWDKVAKTHMEVSKSIPTTIVVDDELLKDILCRLPDFIEKSTLTKGNVIDVYYKSGKAFRVKLDLTQSRDYIVRKAIKDLTP